MSRKNCCGYSLLSHQNLQQHEHMTQNDNVHNYYSPEVTVIMNLNTSTHCGLELKLKLIYDRHSVCLGVGHPSGTPDQFFFLLEISFRQLRVCYFVAPSLTRGQVCNLLYICFCVLSEQSL
jgi:hypothetical protein